MNNLSKHLLTKTLTILVMVSFLIQPMAVFAEEANTEAKTEETVVEAKEVVNEGEMVEDKAEVPEDTNNKDPNEQLNLSKNINGASKKTANDLVNQFTGSAVYNYDFAIPKGRNELSPKVNLSYSSQRKNIQENIYGLGWDLGLQYIGRDSDKGYDNFFANNRFIINSGLDNGELIATSSSTNEYYAKYSSAINKYTFENNYWHVYDSIGNKYIFGSVDDSRIASSSTQVSKWFLDAIEDPNGNKIIYEYYKDSNQVYLKNIKYTVDENNQNNFEVRFYPFYSNPTTANRNDINSNYTNGFKVTTKYKLDRIEVYVDAQVKNKYFIDYQNDSFTKQLILKSIKQTSLNENGAWSELPLTTFDYSQINYQNLWSAGEMSRDLPELSTLFLQSQNTIYQDGDINGDGVVDFLSTFPLPPYSGLPTSSIAYISQPNGYWQNTYNYLKIPEMFQYDWIRHLPPSEKGGMIMLDVNNDGLTDILRSSVHYENGDANYVKRMYINNGNNQFILNTNYDIPFTFAGGISETFRFADINGDKLVDAISSYDYVYPDHGHAIHSLRGETYINNGNGWTGNSAYRIPEPFSQVSDTYGNVETLGTQLIDINADGLTDVVRAIDYYDGQKKSVYLNTGSGFVLAPEWNLPIYLYKYHDNGSWRVFDNGTRFVDVNNDGLPDLIQSTTRSEGKSLFINTGSGWKEVVNPTIPYYITDFVSLYGGQPNWTGDFGVRFYDINGDGVEDMYKGSSDKTKLGYTVGPLILKKITESTGSEINLNYKSSSEYLDSNGNRKNIMRRPQLVLDKTIISDGLGNRIENNYDYSHGFYYYDESNKSNFQFAGFGIVTVTSGNKKVKTYFHQGGGFDGTNFGEKQDDISKKGNIYRQEIYNIAGGQAELVNLNIKKWRSQKVGVQKLLSLDSTINIDDKEKLALVQPLINDYTNTNLNNSSAVQKFDNNWKNIFPEQTGESARFVPDISTDNSDYYYLGKGTAGYEYVGVFGTDSFFTSSTTATTTINKSICAYGSLSTNWNNMVRQYSGQVSDEMWVENSSYGGGSKTLCRVFLPFDTSSIPVDTTTINEAKVEFNIDYTEYENSVGYISGGELSNPPEISPADYSSVREPSSIITVAPTSTLQNIISSFYNLHIRKGSITPVIIRGPLDYDGANIQYYYRSMFRVAGNNQTNPNLSPKLYVKFTTQNPLTKADDLEVNHKVNPINESVPIIFGAKYNNDDLNAMATDYRIVLIKENGYFDSPLWDSGKVSISQRLPGTRVENLPYTGPSLLLNGNKYYWKIKFWDNLGNELLYNTDPAFFSLRVEAQGTSVDYQYETQTNRLIKETNLGRGSYNAMTGELIENIIGDEQTVNYEYAVSTSDKPIVNAIKQKSVYGVGESVNYRTQAHYDNLPYGQVSKNNKTKDDFIVQQINQRYEYNNYGLPIKQIDPTGKETRYEYDATNLYPTKIYNALNQSTTVEYDLSTGQPTLTIDPNGAREERSYDAFGRVVSVKKSSPTDSNQMLEMERYSYDDYSMPKVVKKEVRVDGSNWLTTVEYYDGLGQNIQTRTKHNDKNEYVVVSNKYDNFGRVIKTTLPYLQMEEKYVAEDWNKPVTEKVYDALDRVTKETLPIGENNFAYDNFITTITDANGVQKKLERDAYDRLIAVEEFIEGNFVKTKYSYNVLGKLIKIVDSQNNEREFVYDDLGRLLSQTEAHKPNTTVDPWTYEYDQASRITKQTDPNGNQTTYDYDDLGRVIKQRTSAGEINYEYDNGENAVGRLVNVDSNYGVGYQKHMNYDLWGRVINEDVVINEKPFNSAFEYSLSGQVIKAIQPNQVTIENIYDNQGRFIGFNVIDPERQPRAVIKNVTYHLSGRPSEVFYANSTITNYDYDAQTQRLVNKLTTAKDRKIQSLNYQYDVLGNIIEINDDSKTLTAKKVNYDYDSLSRLIKTTAVNTAGGCDYEETYSYDSLGNILNKSDIGDYLYGNANPHQATTIGDKTYLYDRSGNVVNDGLYEYIYNPENRMVNANALDGGLLSEYSYDPAGTRVYKKVTTNNVAENKVSESVSSGENKEVVINETKEILPEPVLEKTKEEGKIEEVSETDLKISAVLENTEGSVTTETYYPNSFYELTVVGDKENPTIHVYGLGQRLAQLETVKDVSNIKLIFTDHLGSTQQVTDDTGVLLTTYDYYSFGGVRVEDGEGTNKQFSGKIKDETNLNYFEARYLDTSVGRFNQIDPWGGSPVDPQTLNKYSYVGNNPVRMIDPSGMTQEEAIKGYSVGVAVITWNTVKALSETFWSPMQTAKAAVEEVKSAVNETKDLAKALTSNPSQTINEIKEGTEISINEFMDKSDYEKGVAIGKFTGKVMQTAATAKVFKTPSTKLNLGINEVKQARHTVMSSQYRNGKSVLTHQDPQRLINEFVGKGQKIFNQGRLQKEVVDFGEEIGFNSSPNIDGSFTYTPTTKGTIHYSADGTHIVPTHQNKIINVN